MEQLPSLPFQDRVERIEREAPDAVYREAMARGARCMECPLKGEHKPVMGEVRADSKLVIIGEAPGPTECEEGRPFVGWSGGQLNKALVAGGLHRPQTTVTNAALCMPPGMAFGDFLERLDVQHRKAKREWKWLASEAKKRGEEPPPPPEPPLTPQAACRPRLIRDIEESGAKTILAIGNRALEAVAEIEGTTLGAKPKQRPDGSWTPQIMTLKEQHGAPVDLGNGRTLMSAYHPAGAAKGKREMLPIIQENMERAARVALSGWEWPEPNFWIFPSADQVIALLDALVAQGVELIVDIEAGPSAEGRKDAADVRRNFIRCIGVGARCITSESTSPTDLRELVFVIPVRHMDRTLWYSEADTERVRRACARAFDHLPLVGQNFQFDTSVLLRDGYMCNEDKTWTDTLVLHKNSCDNDLPHNLSFITRQFFTLPVWKGVDHNSWNNADDHGLHVYCGKDIVTTMRVLPILRERTAEYECVPQYRVDEALAPVCRNMSGIGIPVNEHKRGEFSKHFNEQCIVHQKKADAILGREINLNSPDQLKDLFYGDTKFGGWGLTPRIATDGYEWDPDKEGSTGGQALVELRKAGLEDFQRAFIDNLFDFRSYSKLKGTYTDNLPLYPAEFDISNIPDAPEVHGFYADPEGVVRMDSGMVVLPKRAGMSVFHPTFKNYVVPGGRLSASPNVQAIPAIGKANIREMFEAPPGHVFVGADWSQLEARIYAIVSGDEVLIDTIKGKHEVTGDSLDIHTMNAASLFATNTSKEERMYWYNKIEYGVGLPFVGDLEIPPAKIKSMSFADALQATKDFIANAAKQAGWKDPAGAWEKIRRKYRKRLRTIAKRFVFLVLYGGEKEKLYSVMASDRDKVTGELTFKDLTPDECLFWYDNWHDSHPWTHQWHERTAYEVKTTGCIRVPILDNRARWFIHGASKKNAIPNHQIQGSAASLANDCLSKIAEAIPFRKWSPHSGLCLQVHDDIKVIVPENRAEQAAAILSGIMNRTWGGIEIPAEVVISRVWADQDKDGFVLDDLPEQVWIA